MKNEKEKDYTGVINRQGFPNTNTLTTETTPAGFISCCSARHRHIVRKAHNKNWGLRTARRVYVNIARTESHTRRTKWLKVKKANTALTCL